MNSIFDSKKGLLVIGLILGVLTAILAATGNPGNMAICAACFIRDTVGSLGLHTAEKLQYMRPEIVGFILGAFIISLATREFRATIGSKPIIRFIIGFIMMIGCLVFLGCPLRMVIRLAAGDLNALVGLVGFLLGVGTGCFFLKKGFSLGRAKHINQAAGYTFPVIALILLILAFTGILYSSTEGPGSMHAPLLVSLIIGLLFGVFAQRSRLCFGGAFRDVIILKDWHLFSIVAGLFIVMLIYNIATNNFHIGFADQPIAHSVHIWNLLGMYAVGLAVVLASGCPLRQMIMSGQGNLDAGITFLGLAAGAACCHRFGWAASAYSVDDAGNFVQGGITTAGAIALIIGIVVLLIIGFVYSKKLRPTK
jgi:YedE family putative selenium metabolism protein